MSTSGASPRRREARARARRSAPSKTSPGLTRATNPTMSAVMSASMHPPDRAEHVDHGREPRRPRASRAALPRRSGARTALVSTPPLSGLEKRSVAGSNAPDSRVAAGAPPSATIPTSSVVESASAMTVATAAEADGCRRPSSRTNCPKRNQPTTISVVITRVFRPMTVTPPCPSKASITLTMSAVMIESHGPSRMPASTVRLMW